ncbi:MAG: helix-turn-helix domain-containing protein [Planctomycetaceae bacterium]
MFDALVARSQSVIATVELFVPLPEQAFACAAMSRLSVRHPSNAVGGLTYLSGPEGSGKSFLARNAIREARRQQPKLVFAIAGAYDLAEALVRVDQSQSLADLLEQFTRLNLLVCDDLQLLEGKPEHQRLLLELMDQLSQQGTHLLITCRKLPGELRDFSPRWVSRCHGGLCTSLPNLSRDSRILFLGRLIETGGSGNSRKLSAAEQRRAEHCPLTFAEPVKPTIEWLADHGPASPRDIVTILNRLGEHSLKRPSLIDVPFLQQWMSETLPAEIISLDSIVAEVANEFGIEPAELRSRSRHQSLIVPRQCAMFLARELTQRPLEFIGQYFGERTHTTVSHCLSRLKELLPHAPTLRQQVQRLQKRITELRREDCA